jgi:predicted RNase H-like HicB family nuclease
MLIVVEIEQEDDGRWLAEVSSMPGVMAYGATQEEALERVEALALRVIADQIDHGERRSFKTLQFDLKAA